MDHFDYRDRTLFCEDVSVPELAEKYGTPLYVYSQAALVQKLTEVQTAFAEAKPVICYSVKANGNLSLCRLMGQNGAGFDVTSQGEFQRALKAGPAGSRSMIALPLPHRHTRSPSPSTTSTLAPATITNHHLALPQEAERLPPSPQPTLSYRYCA